VDFQIESNWTTTVLSNRDAANAFDGTPRKRPDHRRCGRAADG
jgi:hypothetical protein